MLSVLNRFQNSKNAQCLLCFSWEIRPHLSLASVTLQAMGPRTQNQPVDIKRLQETAATMQNGQQGLQRASEGGIEDMDSEQQGRGDESDGTGEELGNIWKINWNGKNSKI